MMRISLAIVLTAILVPAVARADEHTIAYATCMAYAREDPARALEAAQRWIEEGGEGPARHCEAIALLGLLRYADAALALEELVEEVTEAPIEDRADLLEQSAQAWLLAGDAPRAIEALSDALDLRPDAIEYLIGRAIAQASMAEYWEAVDDLNRALMLLYLDDHPYSEIAAILGISETNVATKISRIKQQLKQSFHAETAK